MYKLDYSAKSPETPLIERGGKHHKLLAHCAALKPGESFEVESPFIETRNVQIRSIHWFKRKHGLRLFVEQWGEKSIRVWCLEKNTDHVD